ncbi:hypothetical protein [Kingella oralis]|nr:hypothetical protein [Kingella oralis]
MEDLFCWMGEGRQPEKGAIALGGSELSCSADISGCLIIQASARLASKP